MVAELEREHSKVRLELVEILLQWSDVLVAVEQVRVRSRPIRLILQGVELPQMDM